MVASEKAMPDTCVTDSGFTRLLISKSPGAGYFMLKWSSSLHCLLWKQCLGCPSIPYSSSSNVEKVDCVREISVA